MTLLFSALDTTLLSYAFIAQWMHRRRAEGIVAPRLGGSSNGRRATGTAAHHRDDFARDKMVILWVAQQAPDDVFEALIDPFDVIRHRQP